MRHALRWSAGRYISSKHQSSALGSNWFEITAEMHPWRQWRIDLDLTCFSLLPSSIGAKYCSSFTATWSIAPKPPTCPSCLQPVHQAKSCLDLHLSHMTQCHISYAMSSFITCVSLAINPSHLHRHGMSCSHKCTYGLITCVSHI